MLHRNFPVIVLLFGFVCAIPLASQNHLVPCPRPGTGDTVHDPINLRSEGGSLRVELSYQSYVDAYGLRRYCYVYKGKAQSPTLRVRPGEQLVISLRNDLEGPIEPGSHDHAMDVKGPCGGGALDALATNLHFHGIHVSPGCHEDDVLSTVVRPSEGVYEYHFRIPLDQPPGLYWYHPHPHGFAENQVLGGASGALIIEGIEDARPEVSGLPERILVLRDQKIPGLAEYAEDAGMDKDASINFVPVIYPLYRPAAMIVKPGQREFWRVLNAAADTYFDLQVRFGRIIETVKEPQQLQLIALDGAPIGDKDPTRMHILVPPGSRAEFIVAMPPMGMLAQLVSLNYEMGPDGEPTLFRTLATIRPNPYAPLQPAIPASRNRADVPFVGLTGVTPVRDRKLLLSEQRIDPNDPTKDLYYITPEGRAPQLFDMSLKRPDVVVRQGTVEDWVIENRSAEAHAFHIHQLHFQLLERDGHKINEPALRDTVDLSYWKGEGHPYPSVKLRMDFRSPRIIGTFLYHCHILEHEDGGMMGIIRVDPAR